MMKGTWYGETDRAEESGRAPVRRCEYWHREQHAKRP